MSTVPPPVPDPTRITTENIDKEIKHVRELMEAAVQREHDLCVEQFRAVTAQLALIENRRIELKMDTGVAVAAALSAQKEAVREQTIASDRAIAKSENGTAKEISQMAATFGTAIAGVTDNIGDLKERVGKIENIKVGGTEATQERRAANAALYAAIGFVISLLLTAGPVIAILMSK